MGSAKIGISFSSSKSQFLTALALTQVNPKQYQIKNLKIQNR
jgi:hypothetical protein